MQPAGPEMYTAVVRRPLDIEDYIDVIRRHKSWIIGPTFFALVIAVVVAFLWPDTYVSTATIRIAPPQVPETLVPSNVNSAMVQRINSMYQTVTSRPVLSSIVETYNLYPKDRASKPLVDVIENARRNIGLRGVAPLASSPGERSLPAFQVSFSYADRHVAQKVCEDIVGRFMNENTRERTADSVRTTEFLNNQVENAKRDLDTLDGRVAAFRQSFQGRLPEELTTNSMQMNMAEQRIMNVNANLARLSQERMLLESDLRSLKNQKASLIPSPEQAASRHKTERVASMDREILQLEANLANLREQYKDNYPDVRRVITQLNTAKRMRERILEEEEDEKTQTEAARSAGKRVDPMYEREARQLDASIERLEVLLKTKSLEAESYNKDIRESENQIRSLQARIHASPASDQQFSQLVREQMLARTRYEELVRRQSQSAMSSELERRQQGERLELVDQASLPATPTQPRRLMIIGVGATAGLLVGLFLAGAREAKDNSLKNLKDVRAYTQLPVLGSVPVLEDDIVVRRRRRLAWLAWSTASLVGGAIMAGSVLYYYTTRT